MQALIIPLVPSGRTKPDIVAPGYALDSALSNSGNDCSVKEKSYLKAGTSMAGKFTSIDS